MLDEPEKQAFSSHAAHELIAKGEWNAKHRGSLVGHVDDDEAMGIVIDNHPTPYWHKVFWSVPPDLSVGGKITNALRQAFLNELGGHIDKQRLLRAIDNVMFAVKGRHPIDTWKTDFKTDPASGRCSINLMYSTYGKAGYTVITVGIN